MFDNNLMLDYFIQYKYIYFFTSETWNMYGMTTTMKC